MLFTDLSPFNIQLEAGQQVDNKKIFAAIESAMSNLLVDEQPINVTAAKSTEALNRDIWSLISTSQTTVSIAKIIDALGYVDAFENFNHITWAALHLACDRCDQESRQVIYHRIYTWVSTSTNPKTLNVLLQALLFLLSQPDFTLEQVEADIVVELILAVEDHPHAWFALFSHPSFVIENEKVVTLQSKFIPMLKELSGFLKVSGITQKEEEALARNIFAFSLDFTMFKDSPETQLALIKIGGKGTNISTQTMTLLADICAYLIQQWNFDLDAKQIESIDKPLNKFRSLLSKIRDVLKSRQNMSDTFEETIFQSLDTVELASLRSIGIKMIDSTWEPWAVSGTIPKEIILSQIKQVLEMIEKKENEIVEAMFIPGRKTTERQFLKERSENILRQFADFIMIPNMLDALLKTSQNEAIRNIIEQGLNYASEVFINAIIFGLWRNTKHSSRICKDKSLDWLMSFSAFKSLKFLEHNDARKYLSTIFTANDDFFIAKLFEINRAHSDEKKPLYHCLTTLNTYDDAMIAGVIRLLQEPDFHIEQYYDGASLAFKALPQVNTAWELHRLLTLNHIPEEVSDTGSDNNSEDGAKLGEAHRSPVLVSSSTNQEIKATARAAAKNFDPDVFVAELQHRYNDRIDALSKDRGSYKTIKRLHELAKIVRKKSVNAYNKLQTSIILLQAEITYRIGHYESAKENKQLIHAVQLTAKAAAKTINSMFASAATQAEPAETRKKDTKIAFLKQIKEDLSALHAGTVINQSVPYLWSVYNKVHNSNEVWQKDKSDAILRKWLLETVLHSSTASMTAKTLAFLPETLLEKIFSGITLDNRISNIDVVWKKAFPGKMFQSAEEKRAALMKEDEGSEQFGSFDESSNVDSRVQSGSALTPSARVSYIPYPAEVKKTKDLDEALESILSNKSKALEVGSQLIRVLDYPVSFSSFQSSTWEKLRQIINICDQNSRQVMMRWIYAWLVTINVESEQARFARIFLMSQSEFDLQQVDVSTKVIQPMLMSSKLAEKFLLLSHPKFDLDVHRDPLFLNAASDIMCDLAKYSQACNINDEQKVTLLQNIAKLIKDFSSFSREYWFALFKFSSQVSGITEPVLDYFDELVSYLITNKKISDYSQLINLAMIPGMLEKLLKNNNFSTVEFFKSLTKLKEYSPALQSVILSLLQKQEIDILDFVTIDKNKKFLTKADIGVSQEFVKLPQIKTAAYIAYLCSTADDLTLGQRTEETLRHPETLTSLLETRYAKDFNIFTKTAATNPFSHKRIKIISELLQQIPIEMRADANFNNNVNDLSSHSTLSSGGTSVLYRSSNNNNAATSSSSQSNYNRNTK